MAINGAAKSCLDARPNMFRYLPCSSVPLGLNYYFFPGLCALGIGEFKRGVRYVLVCLLILGGR